MASRIERDQPYQNTAITGPRTGFGEWRETIILVALALVAEAVFLWGFVLPYALPQYYKVPLLDLAQINQHTPESFNYFAVSWVISFLAFGLAFSRCPNRPGRSYLIALCGAAVVFNITLLFMYPTGAADILDYIVRARQLAHYGDNPWVHVPAEAKYASDPLRPFIGGWAGTTSPYGPVWELLAAGASLLAGADIWRNLILFKGLVIMAYGGSCWLTYAILRRVRPDWAVRGLLFFAWNPLLLWETAGNGHNDMVMVFFMLLAFYLATFRNRLLLLAPAALALAALVKFIPVLLLLPLLVLIWRSVDEKKEQLYFSQEALKRVLIGALGFVIVAVVIYAPFWVGTQTIGALWRQDLFTASIPTVVKDFLASHMNMPEAQAMAVVRMLAQIVTVLTVLLQSILLLLRYRPGDEDHGLTLRLFSASYSIIFVYLIFATLWFQPWYQIWLIALTALPARRELLSRTVAVNIGGVANYFVWDFLVLWNNSWGQIVQWTAALVVNLPPLLYTAFQTWGKQVAETEELEQPVIVRPARQSAMTEGATNPPAIRRSATGHE